MPENPTNQPPATFQPRPYNGDLIRKMLTLIAMLVMVLYAMNEAGKPENWAWMGFVEQPTNTSETLTESQDEKITPKAKAQTNSTSDHTNDPTEPAKEPAGTSLNSPVIRLTQTPSVLPDVTSQPPTGLPTESGRFWTSFFVNLKTAEQVKWMGLLEVLSGDRLPTQLPANKVQAKLIDHAAKQREAFNNKILDRISSLSQTSEKRSQVSQDYFEANKFWQKQVFPALTASKTAEDITIRQQQAVVSLSLIHI